MPQSKKDLKKLRQKQNAEAGIVHDPKEGKRKANTVCTVCKSSFIVTAKGVEIKTHLEKHPGKTLADLFPDCATQYE